MYTQIMENKQLSKRETECLNGLIYGMTAKEMARQLNISHRTVESYVSSVKQKFKCHRKSELIRRLFRAGILNINLENS